MATHQIYGYLNGAYYAMTAAPHIVIPDTNDITQSFVKSSHKDDTHEEEIDMYCYHTDLVTEVNKLRVENMKDFLIGNKIKKIDALNNDYVLGVSYEIYNKDGKCIKTGTSSIASSYVMAYITAEIDEEDRLKYRKAYVIDGKLGIEIPSISHYGIKNCCVQGPYTIKLTKMTLKSTIGSNSLYIEEGSQLEYHPVQAGGNYASYHHHCDCDCGASAQHDNFNSNFITNRIGTTMIDQLVVPAILEAPENVEQVELVSFDLSGSQYTIKTSADTKGFIVNMEICLDNFNEVYDKAVIDEILDNNPDPNGPNLPDDCPYPNCPCRVDDDDENPTDDPSDPSETPASGDSDQQTDTSVEDGE